MFIPEIIEALTGKVDRDTIDAIVFQIEAYQQEADTWRHRASEAEGIIADVMALMPPVREDGIFWHSEVVGHVARNIR